MGLFSVVVPGSDDRTVVIECRHCGTTVERGTVTCPTCGSGDIVTYDIR